MTLAQFFTDHPAAALGFSGGVDSSYLLYAGLANGARIKAYFVKTAFQPAFELRDAQAMAERLHADLTVIEADILSNPVVAANPPDRCYSCKKAIFETLTRQAASDGVPLIIDGTNASDDPADRAGTRALAELRVRSPLRDCGITKDEVRRLSKEAGLFTWDKPAYACLATRIPTGRAYTPDLLRRVEKAEDALFALGFTDFRVRVFHEAARLQYPAAQLEAVLAQRGAIREALKPYFETVLVDLESR